MNQQSKMLQVNAFAIAYAHHSLLYYANLPAPRLQALRQHDDTKDTINAYIIGRFVSAARHFAEAIKSL